MARRFFVEKTNIKGDSLILEGGEHNHLAKVLRAKIGDELLVSSKDTEYLCKIEKIEKAQTICKILSKEKIVDDGLNVTLFQASMKGEHMEYVIQKATEIGIKTLVPFLSEFVVAKIDGKKTERFKKISLEACKQSGRKMPMQICDIVPFDEMLKMLSSFQKVIFAYEKSDGNLKDALKGIKTDDSVALIVGSEGGFSETEAQKIVKNKAISVSLGKNILRGETAGLVLSSIVLYEMGQFKKI